MRNAQLLLLLLTVLATLGTFITGASGRLEKHDKRILAHSRNARGEDRPVFAGVPDLAQQHRHLQVEGYPLCVVDNPQYLGDGYCDGEGTGEGYNTEECGWDMGDCCKCSCVGTTSTCGANGYECLDPANKDKECPPSCADTTDCTGAGEICCPDKKVCEVPVTPGACGDPHMTGFRGQKFDFTGEDGAWYSVLDAGPALRLNMRVTSPVRDLPEITYITAVSIMTTGVDALQHTVLIKVKDPHNMDSTCHAGVTPCLAEGALSVEIDGEEALLAPGAVLLAPDVAISAVNLPGACRSFGFEKYWKHKQMELVQNGRRLDVAGRMQDMADWILGDPTATNMVECAQYVATTGESGLFAHDSEHASFQILTPLGTVRLSHGRLHQLPTRDPSDQFDLPDHVAWQMNLAIEHDNMSLEAKGILGETLVPTVDESGKPIMQGMEAIRGEAEDYRVEGPLHFTFAQGQDHE